MNRDYNIGDNCQAEIDLLSERYPEIGAISIEQLGRPCEICGKKTNGIYEHICSECKERLKKLLYE